MLRGSNLIIPTMNRKKMIMWCGNSANYHYNGNWMTVYKSIKLTCCTPWIDTAFYENKYISVRKGSHCLKDWNWRVSWCLTVLPSCFHILLPCSRSENLSPLSTLSCCVNIHGSLFFLSCPRVLSSAKTSAEDDSLTSFRIVSRRK